MNVAIGKFSFSYSEEVFSQQSRKLSGSTCSDTELNSDLYSHPPVPDSEIRCDVQPNITKKDIVNLQNEMQCLLDKISSYTLENITDEDFSNLKNEIAKTNLNNLLKFDLSLIRSDLQNKYHAELEVMREDNENKFDELRIKYENNLQNLDAKYREEVENLKIQLEDMQKQNMSLCSAVQEVVSYMFIAKKMFALTYVLSYSLYVLLMFCGMRSPTYFESSTNCNPVT